MEKKSFTVTEEHIKLFKKAHVAWDPAEFGAPGINPKKPYGNSNVLENIAEIIGLELFEDEDNEKHLSKEQGLICRRLHTELETALQILLSNCPIETGKYECDKYHINWQKVD